MEEYIEIGQIVNTNGLHGLLKIKPFTDDITRFTKLKTIYIVIKDKLIEHKIQEVKYIKNNVLLKLDGIDNVEEAEKLKNYYMKIKREDAIKLPQNSYFISDILNCSVYVEGKNELLGKIDDIFSTGSNDVYVVKTENGKQILLPAIKDVIKTVDIVNKKIVVNLIEGLV